jgi:hypothetical protein
LQLRRNRERSGEFWQKIPERLTPAGRRSTSTRRAQLGGIVLRGLRSPPRCTTRHCRLERLSLCQAARVGVMILGARCGQGFAIAAMRP